MSEYARLFVLFRDRLMELAIEECCREQRPLYLLDTGETWGIPVECDWCHGAALYTHRPYQTEHWDPPIPWMARDHTCGSPMCLEAQAWFFDAKNSGSRRRALMKRFGTAFWGQSKEQMLEQALITILEGEARKADEKHTASKTNEGHHSLSVGVA